MLSFWLDIFVLSTITSIVGKARLSSIKMPSTCVRYMVWNSSSIHKRTGFDFPDEIGFHRPLMPNPSKFSNEHSCNLISIEELDIKRAFRHSEL